MRETEVYETFCRRCLRKFEDPKLDVALKAVEEHERECPKEAK